MWLWELPQPDESLKTPIQDKVGILNQKGGGGCMNTSAAFG